MYEASVYNPVRELSLFLGFKVNYFHGNKAKEETATLTTKSADLLKCFWRNSKAQSSYPKEFDRLE